LHIVAKLVHLRIVCIYICCAGRINRKVYMGSQQKSDAQVTSHIGIVRIRCAGRINKKVHMGNLAAAEALAMVRHYFPDVSQRQQHQLLDSWLDGVVSPAALEALCAEFEEVDGLLVAAQQLLASVTGIDNDRKTAGRMLHSKKQQQQVMLQQKTKEAEAKVFAVAAGCCESSAGAGGSCFIIRASSCAASFGAGGCGSSSPFDAAAVAYTEHN
jgi:hypothetical protein